MLGHWEEKLQLSTVNGDVLLQEEAEDNSLNLLTFYEIREDKGQVAPYVWSRTDRGTLSLCFSKNVLVSSRATGQAFVDG